MAKVKYDVEGVESGGDFEQAKPGIYPAVIREAEYRNADGKHDIHVICEITDPANTYSWLHSYISFSEAARWKMREFTDALGMPEKGTIDTDKLASKKLRIKVGAGTYEGEYQARLQRFLKFKDDEDEEDEEEEEDAVEADDGDAEDYSEWEVDDLKAELEERELDVPTGRGAALKKKLIAALEADDAGDDDEDEEEEEEEDDDNELPDFETLSLAELKKLASDAGLEVKGPKSKYVAALTEHHSDGDGDAEPEDDYDDWTAEELVAEAKDRELELPKGRKDKAKMIALLREDDASEPF